MIVKVRVYLIIINVMIASLTENLYS